jgi:hypothetical protein
MSIKTIISIVLKVPMIILVLASFAASIYASVNNISGITYAVPVILGIILILYFVGTFLRKSSEEESDTNIFPTSE